MDRRNRPRLKHIERLGQKSDFSPWGRGSRRTHEGAERGRERESSTEEDPREAPHKPLKPSVTGGGSWERGAIVRPCPEREREFWERGNSSGA
jgi:hypothetical protein